MMKQRWGLDRNVLRPTPGDPYGIGERKHLWDWWTKVCSNGPGHMTKMAAMPIFGKNLKQFSSPEPKSRWPWILNCIIECSSTTKFARMMTMGWPWPILRQGQIWSLCYVFLWEKGKTMDFSETIVVYDLKLTTEGLSDKKFLLTSKLCPLGVVCLLPRGYIHVLNHDKKNVSNQTSKRFLWNLQQIGKVIRAFCWHQNFVPWGLYASCPGAIYML